MRDHTDLDTQHCYVHYPQEFDKSYFLEQVSFFVENFSSSENEELEDPLDTAVGICQKLGSVFVGKFESVL